MEEEPIVLLDIETKLKEDASGEIANGLVKNFEEEIGRIKTQMDSGLTPDDFQTAEKMTAALESSIIVVRAMQPQS